MLSLISMAAAAAPGDASPIPSSVWPVIASVVIAVIGALTGVYVRRDIRAGRAEDAITNEHVVTDHQWTALVSALQSQLEAADEKCQRQMAQLRADLEAQLAQSRRELDMALRRVAHLEAVQEGREPGGATP